MLRYVKFACLLPIIALTSCSYIYGDKGIIQNRDKDYLQAHSIPAIQIPPGLSSSTMQAHFPVSDKEYPEASKKVVITPPGLVPASAASAKNVEPEQTKQEQPASEVIYSTPAGKKQKVVVPDYYFDNHTRGTTTRAGTPLGSALNYVWPWAKKQPSHLAQNSDANSSGNNSENMQNNANQDLPDYDTEAAQTEKEQSIKRHYFDPHSGRH